MISQSNNLIISLLKIVFDGRPVFFKQKRLGQNNTIFTIYKFRTMKNITPQNLSTHEIKNPNVYNTNFGKILRKYSVDEIPQLFNVLKGDMAFIGPRPSLPNESILNNLRSKHGLFKCKPGVTGWAQVNGRDNNSFEKKTELDLFYVENKSFLLNTKIILLTFKILIKPTGIYPD